MMPGSDVERAVGQFRRALLQKERAAASEMVRVYGEAWQRIQAELVHLDVEYKALLAAGQKPDRAWIYQQARMQAMRSQIENELHRNTEYAYETVRREQAAAIASAEEHAEVLTRRALGRAPAGVSVQWNRIPTGAVEQMIGMGQADSPLRLLLAEIAPRGAQAAMDVLIQGMLLGKNPRALAPQLRAVLGGELFRSLRIARTETLRAYREATRLSYKANDDIVEGWIWHSAADKRTCGSCWAMHGTVHKLEERLDDHPSGRCLTPGTVVSGPLATAFVSRYYEGDVVTIRTASGKLLTVTPNHPVLTSRGWVAADLIKEGDNVISYTGNEGGSSSVGPDDYQVPTAVENIPGSLDMARFVTVPTSPKDFHGDGIGSNIHVIFTNRFLGDGIKTSFFKPFFKKYFCGRLSKRHFFSGDRSSKFFFKRDNSTPYSILGDFDSSMVFFDRNTLRKQSIGFSLGSETDIVGVQPGSDYTSRYPEGFGKKILRLSRQISLNNFRFWNIKLRSSGFPSSFSDELVTGDYISEQVMRLQVISQALWRSVKHGSSVLHAIARDISFDRVFEISVTRFSGHVYNLQTSVGWYIANGIITHNCSMVPQTKTWAEIGKAYGIDLSDVPETRADVELGASLFGKLSREEQIGVLGPAKWAAWRDGRITLDGNPVSGIVGVRKNTVWGSMRYERSLRGILGADEATKYTRLALMGVAQRSGDYTTDDLIRIAGIGLRDLTSDELQSVVAHVASAGFDPNGLERCGGRLSGLVWNGKVLKGSDLLPPGEAHYLRHVVAQGEWPEGTTLSEYYQSLERVVRDENSKILVSKFGDEWQIGFLGEKISGTKYNYLWVDYRASEQHWMSGLQIEDLDQFLLKSGRTILKWLR